MTSIKDVAQASGVSPTTVSFVLNNSGVIGAATRERVLKVAKELNYVPNAIARGFLSKRMNTVGVVAFGGNPAPLTNPYFAGVVDGIAAAARVMGQNITLFTGEIWSDAEHSLPIFSDGRCDGLLLVGPHTKTDIISALLERRVPFVLINERSENPRVSEVDVDDDQSAFVLTQYLLELGHRRFGLLRQEGELGFAIRREAGCRRALNSSNHLNTTLVTIDSDLYTSTSKAALSELMRQPAHSRPTALICTDDSLAIKAIRDLKSLGVTVPRDISVAGFDDLWAAVWSDIQLTTVRQSFDVIGKHAVDILLGQIQSGKPSGDKVLIKGELIVRDSVGAPES